MKTVRESRIWLQSFLIAALEGSEWLIYRPGRFTPEKEGSLGRPQSPERKTPFSCRYLKPYLPARNLDATPRMYVTNYRNNYLN